MMDWCIQNWETNNAHSVGCCWWCSVSTFPAVMMFSVSIRSTALLLSVFSSLSLPEMTYIVSSGALNSTHSLLFSHYVYTAVWCPLVLQFYIAFSSVVCNVVSF